MDNHHNIIAAIAVLLAVVASFVLGCNITRKRYESALNRPDTVFVEKWLRDTIYQPRDSFIVKWQTAYLPVHDTTYLCDTTRIVDSVLVDVPISEKNYASENYRATIRGYQAELVDIWVKQKETIVKIPYLKHWSVTLGPQVGYGFTPQGWQPYAGVGATFGYSF